MESIPLCTRGKGEKPHLKKKKEFIGNMKSTHYVKYKKDTGERLVDDVTK